MESKIVYFDSIGPENTEETFRITRQRANELAIKTIVIASTSGDTAVKAVESLKGFRTIFVSHSFGFKSPNTPEFTDEHRRIVESKGGTVLTTTHAFAGINRAMRKKLDTCVTGDIIANTLRTMGQGIKVACEITMMAADSGLVRTDEEIIAIAGTSHGSDTALVMKPVYTHDFFDLKIREILCKTHF